LPKGLDMLVEEGIMAKIKTDGWGVPLHYDSVTGEIWSDGGSHGKKISSKDLW